MSVLVDEDDDEYVCSHCLRNELIRPRDQQACALEGVRCVLLERDPVAAELARVRLSKPVQPCLSA